MGTVGIGGPEMPSPGKLTQFVHSPRGLSIGRGAGTHGRLRRSRPAERRAALPAEVQIARDVIGIDDRAAEGEGRAP